MTAYTGTAGSDTLNGKNTDDTFDATQGGDDTVTGGGGDDVIDFGVTFNENDHVFGGNGFDTLKFSGGYSISDTFLIDGIEKVVVADGFSYGLFFAAGALAAGHTMTVDGHALTVGHMLYFDSQSEDGNLVITGGDQGDIMFTGHGDDVINGGAGSDSIDPGDGTDTVNGGAGDDLIFFGGNGKLDAADRINGGDAGPNRLDLFGDYSAGLTFNAHTIRNITTLELKSGFFLLNLSHATLPDAFTVDAHFLGAGDLLSIDASGQRRTMLTLHGGGADDVLIGGDDHDTFIGALGADRLTGNGGQDTFQYDEAAESTGPGYDTVVGFDAHRDFIFPGFTLSPGTVDGINTKVTHGKLTAANFDNQLANAIGAGELGADHAVLFQPDSGGLAGKMFLIVDGNNTAGYQAGDLVVLFQSPHHMGDFDITNFGAPL